MTLFTAYILVKINAELPKVLYGFEQKQSGSQVYKVFIFCRIEQEAWTNESIKFGQEKRQHRILEGLTRSLCQEGSERPLAKGLEIGRRGSACFSESVSLSVMGYMTGNHCNLPPVVTSSPFCLFLIFAESWHCLMPSAPRHDF